MVLIIIRLYIEPVFIHILIIFFFYLDWIYNFIEIVFLKLDLIKVQSKNIDSTISVVSVLFYPDSLSKLKQLLG